MQCRRWLMDESTCSFDLLTYNWRWHRHKFILSQSLAFIREKYVFGTSNVEIFGIPSTWRKFNNFPERLVLRAIRCSCQQRRRLMLGIPWITLGILDRKVALRRLHPVCARATSVEWQLLIQYFCPAFYLHVWLWKISVYWILGLLVWLSNWIGFQMEQVVSQRKWFIFEHNEFFIFIHMEVCVQFVEV